VSQTSVKQASLLLFLVLPACTVTRPIATSPAPQSLENYLRAHPRAALRVVDSTGRARWVYEATLRADTLRGLRAPTMPRQLVTIPLGEVAEVGASRMSPVRTLGFIGGILALGAALALMAPGPTY
jgi:hypothetical protein